MIGVFFSACKGGDKNTTDDTPTVPLLEFNVVSAFPHDTSSYTQGLIVYKGQLYEGTGIYGASALLKTDLTSGKALQRRGLDKVFFGEGVTILNDTIYQLTWKENKVFVYDLDFKLLHTYAIDKEGWGLTHNGKELILSNGTGNLFFYSPDSMRLLRILEVTENGSPSFNLNELEYADGYVYANQYTYPFILKIDIATGHIIGKYDLSRLLDECRQLYGSTEVLNGIAYDSDQKKWYVTGKNWPRLYQVQWGH